MLKTIHFRTGDLVQLKLKDSRGPNPFRMLSGNIYQITRMDIERVRLSWQSETYRLEDLQPIPINGKDDYAIRLQVTKADPCVMDGMNIPQEDKDFSYYLDRIQDLGWDSLLELIKQQKIKYVHQVQRYLDDHFAHCRLEPDY